eukprot:gnl/TRDRNA2_/TRDRNA2_75602_c0_seq2.p1 gnl/TRDRNA2_/TRDRNA2_75602_c0~~gnl/TRDRNA2_/TRDRNA2_75602_c0_seq2.p1  ORF type:complete len:690 (+),score=42.05 gnl/TRDRNA2_/TRDRNA2_75602_c0_seq2:3-2072(+)
MSDCPECHTSSYNPSMDVTCAAKIHISRNACGLDAICNGKDDSHGGDKEHAGDSSDDSEELLDYCMELPNNRTACMCLPQCAGDLSLIESGVGLDVEKVDVETFSVSLALSYTSAIVWGDVTKRHGSGLIEAADEWTRSTVPFIQLPSLRHEISNSDDNSPWCVRPVLTRGFDCLRKGITLSGTVMSLSSNASKETDDSVDDPVAAEFLANFRLYSSDVLRGTFAAVPLRWLAAPMRRPTGRGISAERSGDQFEKSFRVDRLDDFWSHSWGASPLLKSLTLLVYYNGVPAGLFSILGAYVTCILTILGILPELRPSWAWVGCSVWSQGCGFVVFWITLFLWQPRRRIFLDKVCIQQNDERKKAQAIESIGGILKNTNCLLLLWDPTYFTRIWCVFELAAFAILRALLVKQGGVAAKRLLMRPIFVGAIVTTALVCVWSGILIGNFLLPVGINLVYVTLSAVAGFFPFCTAMHALRGHVRNCNMLRGQMETFSFAKAQCFCCDVKHRHPDTGLTIPCDRQLVRSAILAWFGGEDEFNLFVRTELVQVVRMQRNQDYYSYCNAVMSSLPVLWYKLDMVGYYGRINETEVAVMQMVDGVFWWLAMVPLTISVFSLVAAMLRRERDKFTSDMAVSIAGTVVGMVPCILLVFVHAVCWDQRISKSLWAGIVFDVAIGLIAVCVFRYNYSSRIRR